MTPVHYDTVVIGAGLAGLVAALRHTQQGRRTLLLAHGMGALSWSHGCIDVLPVPQPLAALAGLPAEHPYHKVGAQTLLEASAWFKHTLQQQGYSFGGSPERSVLVPTAVGTWNAVALLPSTMVASTASNLQGANVLVVGMRELRDFYPALIAERLASRGIAASAVEVPLPPTHRRTEWSALQLARLLEDSAFRTALAQAIRERRGNASVVLLPAVLGLANASHVVHELQTTIGALVGEIPTLPTVIPGLRLERALRAAFSAAGGQLQLNARVVRGDWQGRRLEAVWSTAAARMQQHRAEHFILATGGIGGGGLRADYPDLLRETTLGLPLLQPQARQAWFDPTLRQTQPVYQAGIAVDARFHACDEHQRPSDNLQVIGNALAGIDPVRTHCAGGVALATGWFVGSAEAS